MLLVLKFIKSGADPIVFRQMTVFLLTTKVQQSLNEPLIHNMKQRLLFEIF